MRAVREIIVFYFVFTCFYYSLFSKTWVYFSPQDNISKKLVGAIDESKHRIYAAIYMFTDNKVAHSLIRAKQQRGLDVQVVVDEHCLESAYNKIELLKNNGVDVFIFKSKHKKQNKPIMHNKFALLDNVTWTGSYNWTRSANTQNSENVLCNNKIYICKKYEAEFEDLKRKCYKTTKRVETQNFENRHLRSKVFKFLKRLRDNIFVN